MGNTNKSNGKTTRCRLLLINRWDCVMSRTEQNSIANAKEKAKEALTAGYAVKFKILSWDTTRVLFSGKNK